MADDDFAIWLGRIASDRPLAHRLRAAINRAGGPGRATRSSFTGARIGRAAAVGQMLASRGGWTGRRVVVKTSVVKLGGKGLAGATAHLRYLQRDGTTRDGERGTLYGADSDVVDGKAFLERGTGDRHQFRFIVAPEDGAEFDDLKPFVRSWMRRVEQDLDTRLDWVAVDHFNTGHPHSHVIVRGRDHLGKDLIIARDYLTQGLRARACELVDLQLGPRSPAEIARADAREVEQERFTSIDRRLLAARGDDGLVSAAHANGVEQSLRAGRLQTLGRMGLAVEEKRGAWRLDGELRSTLKRMGERNDIVRTMQREMAAQAPERSSVDFAVHDVGARLARPVIGRVVERGLSDEHADRHFLIIDGVDGRSHFLDIGNDATETGKGWIVRVAPVDVGPRAVDRTIAAIAAVNDGTYSIDVHLRNDPTATEAYAETHVRRLEAIRRSDNSVERRPDGSWVITPDHLDRVEAYERARAGRQPVMIEPLSTRPLDQLPDHHGATWLDRELVAEKPEQLERGFGADVRRALDARRQWLVEQQLADIDGDTVRIRRNFLSVLQLRELRSIANGLSNDLDKPFVEARSSQPIEGIYRRAVQVGDRKFALIENAREFSLVPWRPVLERSAGKVVSGIVRENGISWTVGRSKGLGIS